MTLKDLWELAKTPMAAPESLSLKRMRIAWLCLCVMLALSIGQLAYLKSVMGPKAALIPLPLLLIVPILGWRYFHLKRIADDRWLFEERS